MSYLAQSQLENDETFRRRTSAASIQQAEVFKDSQLANEKALAAAIMRGELQPGAALNRLAAGGPGIAEKVDTGDGTVDQSLVTDADLLALTQANWPVVAALYYDADGAPLAS
jgi:hypothetical protein